MNTNTPLKPGQFHASVNGRTTEDRAEYEALCKEHGYRAQRAPGFSRNIPNFTAPPRTANTRKWAGALVKFNVSYGTPVTGQGAYRGYEGGARDVLTGEVLYTDGPVLAVHVSGDGFWFVPKKVVAEVFTNVVVNTLAYAGEAGQK